MGEQLKVSEDRCDTLTQIEDIDQENNELFLADLKCTSIILLPVGTAFSSKHEPRLGSLNVVCFVVLCMAFAAIQCCQ